MKRETNPGLKALHKKGTLYAPKQISWRRAYALQSLGFATVYPFHNRWQGRVRITEKGTEEAMRV